MDPMSGDWIKMRTSLPRNPKVVRLSVTLKAHASAVCGACFVLWALADEHSEDGRLPGYTYEVIDAVVGLPGFCAAASDPEVGWVSTNAQGIVLPRFSDHNGATAKRRANGSKRANKLREKASRTRNARSVTKCAPREEKRREDNSSNTKAAAGDGFSGEEMAARVEYLLKRPEWANVWISRRGAEELAAMPITIDDVTRVYAEARKSRTTLKNPAGYVVAELKRIAEGKA